MRMVLHSPNRWFFLLGLHLATGQAVVARLSSVVGMVVIRLVRMVMVVIVLVVIFFFDRRAD